MIPIFNTSADLKTPRQPFFHSWKWWFSLGTFSCSPTILPLVSVTRESLARVGTTISSGIQVSLLHSINWRDTGEFSKKETKLRGSFHDFAPLYIFKLNGTGS